MLLCAVVITFFNYWTIIVAFVNWQVNAPGTCTCTLNDDASQNSTGDFQYLQCHRSGNTATTDLRVPCQQFNKLVRVGPLEQSAADATLGDQYYVNFNSTIKIMPWGLSDLVADGSVDTMQLDLQLKKHEVNALSLAGLETIRELLARTSLVRWDECSFANLKSLKRLLLSCKSVFPSFLTFTSALRVIRFVDCEQVPLQFYCVNCLQDRRINVIRIHPGPPLRQYMVKFSQFHKINTDDAVKLPDEGSILSVGKCVPNICSDNMMCRTNAPLQMVLSNVGRPSAFETISQLKNPSSSNVPYTNNVSIVDNETSHERSTNDAINKFTDNTVLAQELMYLPKTCHIWIVASIASVIIVFFITLCVLIAMSHQQKNTRRSKTILNQRMCPQPTHNGLHNEIIFQQNTEAIKLELPDQA